MRKLLSVISLLAVAATLSAQKTSYDLVVENPDRAANTLHCYEALDLNDTPAPDGFKPFYISHIGRHGSRYQDKADTYDSAIKMLSEFKEKKLLTRNGENLLKGIVALKNASEGNYGKLTDTGRKEHAEISDRMFKRFPDVFSNPERREIIACSTPSGRVAESRDVFLSTLRENDASLKFSCFVGSDVYDGATAYVRVKGRKITDEEKELSESLAKVKLSPEKNPHAVNWDDALQRIFKVDKVRDRKAAVKALERAYSAIMAAQCIPDKRMPVIADFFTADEVYTMWYKSNFKLFRKMSICEENRGVAIYPRACPILKHLVEDADKAIEGNGVAANLRFSHDLYCQPFFSLVGAAGNDYQGSAVQANAHYLAFQNVCMACNMQFIFYRNPEGVILVKLLQNEREVTVPSLETVCGVYHDWTVLRPYLAERYSRDKK